MYCPSTELSPEVRHEHLCELFAVVSFPTEEDSLFIVASSWLEKTEANSFYICSWPPYKGDARIKTAVLENEMPTYAWSKCSARLIKKCCTYESAEDILKAIEIVSTRRSEILFEKKCKQGQREISLKQLKEANLLSSQLFFNSSSSDSSHSCPVISAVTANADESFLHGSSLISVEDSAINSLGENVLLHNSTSTTSVKDRSNSLSALTNFSCKNLGLPASCYSSNIQIQTKASNERLSRGDVLPIQELNSCVPQSSVELEVLKTVNEIKEQLTQNSNEIKEFRNELLNLKNKISESIENFELANEDVFKDLFPFSTSEDLQLFDIKLKDNNLKQKLIKHFCKIGGTSAMRCTNNLLKFIMKHSVAIEYCWYGSNHGKKAFCRLELVDVIQKTVRVHFENATDAEIMKFAQDWFRHAKEKLEYYTRATNRK